MQRGFVLTRFIERLKARSNLSESDIELLSGLPYRLENVCRRRPLSLVRGESECCLVVHGMVAVRGGAGETASILSLHVPGDVPDLAKIHDSGFELKLSVHGLVVVALISARQLQQIAHHSPRIQKAFSRLLLAELTMLRQASINIGSRDALQRIAHLCCDLCVRSDAVGLAEAGEIACPLTQADLAAACAISPVHVNRTLQELRGRKLLDWRSGSIRVLDWQGLTRLADFSSAYLRIPAGTSLRSFSITEQDSGDGDGTCDDHSPD
jgi:hypothetical protein